MATATPVRGKLNTPELEKIPEPGKYIVAAATNSLFGCFNKLSVGLVPIGSKCIVPKTVDGVSQFCEEMRQNYSVCVSVPMSKDMAETLAAQATELAATEFCVCGNDTHFKAIEAD